MYVCEMIQWYVWNDTAIYMWNDTCNFLFWPHQGRWCPVAPSAHQSWHPGGRLHNYVAHHLKHEEGAILAISSESGSESPPEGACPLLTQCPHQHCPVQEDGYECEHYNYNRDFECCTDRHGEGGAVADGEGDVKALGDGLRQQGLPASSWTKHHDVRLFQLRISSWYQYICIFKFLCSTLLYTWIIVPNSRSTQDTNEVKATHMFGVKYKIKVLLRLIFNAVHT